MQNTSVYLCNTFAIKWLISKPVAWGQHSKIQQSVRVQLQVSTMESIVWISRKIAGSSKTCDEDQAGWHMPLMSALGRQRHLDLRVQGQPGVHCEIQTSQEYIVSPREDVTEISRERSLSTVCWTEGWRAGNQIKLKGGTQVMCGLRSAVPTLPFSLRKRGSHLKVLSEVRCTDLTLTKILFLPGVGKSWRGRGRKTEAEHKSVRSLQEDSEEEVRGLTSWASGWVWCHKQAGKSGL